MASNEYNSVYFMHIPKTAGTSLIHFLSTLFTHRTWQQGLLLRSVYSTTRFIDTKLLGESKLLFGHIPLSLSFFQPKPTLKITFLRNPIDLVLSYFIYNQKRGLVSKDICFSEFIRSPYAITISNIQTRWLAEYSITEPSTNLYSDLQLLNPECLEIAKTNLELFDFIGNASDFNQSIASLSQSLDMPLAETPMLNQSRLSCSISDDDLSVILELNQFDLQIYLYAFDILNKNRPARKSIINDYVTIRKVFESPHRGFFSVKDNPFVYRSFYPFEVLPTGEVFRWSKADATFDLPVALIPDTKYTLNIHITNYISRARINSLKIFLNGLEVSPELSFDQSTCHIKVLFTPSVSMHGPNIKLQTDHINDTLDHRNLGLAIDWIYCGIVDDILEQDLLLTASRQLGIAE